MGVISKYPYFANIIYIKICIFICYLHAWKSKSLTAYNSCYERARDLISFPVDRKLESISENVKILIDPESWLGLPKTVFVYISIQISAVVAKVGELPNIKKWVESRPASIC